MPDAAPARTWAVMEAELLYPPTTTIVSLSAAAAARRARGVGIGARACRTCRQAGGQDRQYVRCMLSQSLQTIRHQQPVCKGSQEWVAALLPNAQPPQRWQPPLHSSTHRSSTASYEMREAEGAPELSRPPRMKTRVRGSVPALGSSATAKSDRGAGRFELELDQ